MGLSDFMVQRVIKNTSKKTADFMAKTYPVIQAQNPGLSEKEVLKKIFVKSIDISSCGKSAVLEARINTCCQSAQGLCYLLVTEFGPMRGFMKFRCLQFTRQMDKELSMRGFRPQSLETKERVLESLNLLVDGWERFA